MTVKLFSARRVAEELANNEVTTRERGYYLVASFLMFVFINYSALFAPNAAWTWLSLFEAIVVILVTIYGLTSNYDAAGGDSNPDFVVEFTCLYVPVTITTTLLVWGVYWAIAFGFREAIQGLADSHYQIAVNLHRIGSNFFGLLTFLAVVLVQTITFGRITRLFRFMSSVRK